jgi:tRNA1(Val) A37 N6-methylase TrmN6
VNPATISEPQALDQIFSSMIRHSRSSGERPDLPILIGLMSLRYLLDQARSKSKPEWNALIDSSAPVNPGAEVLSIANFLERLHPKLTGVFSSILLSGLARTRPALLKLWCQEVSRLTESVVLEEEFGRWIAFSLPDYGRDLTFYGTLTVPRGLASLMAKVLDVQQGNSILDPSCGPGTLLAAVIEAAKQNDFEVDIFGEEVEPVNWALAILSFYFYKNGDTQLVRGDALQKRGPSNEHRPKTFDRVISDPPMGFRRHSGELGDHLTAVKHAGLRSKSFQSEALFVEHTLACLSPKGKAVLLVPQGFLFRSGYDQLIRETLLNQKRLQTVISLPAKRIPSSSIEIALLIIAPNPSGAVRFLDAAPLDNPRYGQRDLSPEVIDGILEILKGNKARHDHACFVSRDDLLANESILLPRRYLTSSESEPGEDELMELRAELRTFDLRAQKACAEMDQLVQALDERYSQHS